MANYKKIYTDHYGSPPKGWHIHHIDWVDDNNSPNNLYALPSKLHKIIHDHLGIINRDKLDVVLSQYLKIKDKNCTKNYIVFKLQQALGRSEMIHTDCQALNYNSRHSRYHIGKPHENYTDTKAPKFTYFGR